MIEGARQWVRSLDLTPLKVKKEILGFCFNSVWRAVKKQVLYMACNGFVDYQDIDRAWRVFTGMPYGPFTMMDMVGLDVVYDIEMSYYNESKDPKDLPPQAFKDMIDRKELGADGKGFSPFPTRLGQARFPQGRIDTRPVASRISGTYAREYTISPERPAYRRPLRILPVRRQQSTDCSKTAPLFQSSKRQGTGEKDLWHRIDCRCDILPLSPPAMP